MIQRVENNASSVAAAVAPQMLTSIIGQNLATSTLSASGYPLPSQLAGTSVTFNGFAAPLLYVSPNQINAQVPTGVQSAGQASVIVTTPAGASDPVSVTVEGSSVGIFTQDETGCGQAAAYNVHSDGSVSLNTPQSSLDPASDWGLTIFLTGLGAFQDRVDGRPFKYTPEDTAGIIAAWFTTGLSQQSGVVETTYAGPAPGQVGVDQVNAMLAADSRNSYPEGCKVALYLTDYPDSASQLVNISVHKGGGVCADSPADSLGLATWRKSMVSDPVSPSASDSLSIQFLQSAGIGFPQPPVLEESLGGGPLPPQPSFCAASYPASLDAGTLTVTGPSGTFSLASKSIDGVLGYQSTLPAGSIQGGSYSVIDQNGGPGVGPFTANAQLPPPVSITTDLRPGTTVPRDTFLLNWTGGDSRSRVTVQYIVTSSGKTTYTAVETFSAESNELLDLCFFGGFAGEHCAPPGEVEIIFTQAPSSVPSQPFNAPGLTLGGEQAWQYVFDFKGLTNQ